MVRGAEAASFCLAAGIERAVYGQKLLPADYKARYVRCPDALERPSGNEAVPLAQLVSQHIRQPATANLVFSGATAVSDAFVANLLAAIYAVDHPHPTGGSAAQRRIYVTGTSAYNIRQILLINEIASLYRVHLYDNDGYLRRQAANASLLLAEEAALDDRQPVRRMKLHNIQAAQALFQTTLKAFARYLEPA